MKNDKTSNKPIYKQWWFWVAIVAVLAIIGFATQGVSNSDTSNNDDNKGGNSQNVGTLPTVNKADYTGKEGLVAFKELVGKGYSVTAKYVNEKVPATNQDFTEQFTNSDINSCEARLGYDAYIVDSITQDGDTISLILGNEPNMNQTCPDGTVNDL